MADNMISQAFLNKLVEFHLSSLQTGVKLLPELVDNIIDQSHSDTHALANFSLVCKEWLCSSRYHLFRTVRLSRQSAMPFMELLDSPLTTIPPYVRHIELLKYTESDTEPRWLDRAIDRLKYFPVIQFMTVESRGPLLIETRNIMRSHYTTVTRLEMISFVFDQFSEAVALLCSFPLLQALLLHADVSRGGWREKSLPAPDRYHPPRTLQTLDLACETEDVLAWYLSLKSEPTLSSIRLHFILPVEIPYIARFLPYLGASLKYLHMGFRDVDVVKAFSRAVDLSSNTSLRSIGLERRRKNHQNIIMIAPLLLSQIQSFDMEKVVLSFCSSSLTDVEEIPWSGIEQALSRPQFSRLQSIIIRLLTVKDQDEEIAYIRKCLSRWDKQGILHFSDSNEEKEWLF